MNLYLDIASPAMKQAGENASSYGLQNHGLTNLHRVYWNLPTPALYEEAIFRGEGRVSHLGPLVVNTGKHTARAAPDKFVVRENTTEDRVWWGQYNRPFTTESFNGLLMRLQSYLQGRDVFVQDLYAGACPEYRMPIRIVTEHAWHSLFARTMFVKIRSIDALKKHVPDFTIICAPSFKASPLIDGTRTETFIVLNFAARMAIIGGTAYGGEIKKSIFTVLNFLLPFQDVLPMHCSANIGKDGSTALFFGLSGTGKTTLSADPNRGLIGDDEHGWSNNGIFNFEDGSILENVTLDPLSRRLDLNDDTATENTRAAYPLEYIENVVPSKMGGHPKNVIFLTCDATGVMPPIARLSPDQAIYHFISGYTSKIAGTEIGLGVEPEVTFSTCFGGPFMVHHPYAYAEMLKARLIRYGVTCWLVNTGWTGGPFGVGKRISIHHTRKLLDAALEGKLAGAKYHKDPVFGFDVPKSCEGVPSEILDPANTWPDRQSYFAKYDALAARFIENFKMLKDGCPPNVVEAGPKRLSSTAAAKVR
jgi:phosphoenolpyruvate carboxykinase (ATP)